jgi:hypothetical protein
MPITKSKTPNEFLVRWSDAGVIQGAHIVFRESVIEDGEELSSKMLPAQPVSLAGEAGFPLADVLDILQADALGTIEAKDAEIATLKADAEKAKTDAAQALSAMTSERDAAIAQAAALQAQIDAAAPPTVNGVPQSITPAQGETQLLREGLLDAVRGILAHESTPEEMKIAFARASIWERQSPSVLAMMAALKKSDADADAFFTAAAQIKL